MPKFSVHVALMSPDFRAVTFAPGDDVPEWAVDQVGAHCIEAEEAAEEQAIEPETQLEDDPSDEEPEDAAEDAPAGDVPDFTAPARRRGRQPKGS